MESGVIVKSENFHKPAYWVVKCDNPDLPGTRNGELPIDSLSMEQHHYKKGLKVKFEPIQLGSVENYKWYAKLIL